MGEGINANKSDGISSVKKTPNVKKNIATTTNETKVQKPKPTPTVFLTYKTKNRKKGANDIDFSYDTFYFFQGCVRVHTN